MLPGGSSGIFGCYVAVGGGDNVARQLLWYARWFLVCCQTVAIITVDLWGADGQFLSSQVVYRGVASQLQWFLKWFVWWCSKI